MLSALDIVLISLGGACIVIYATLKIIQVVKFKKLVKICMEHDMTELEARKKAYESVYHKNKKQNIDEVNQDDDIIDD